MTASFSKLYLMGKENGAWGLRSVLARKAVPIGNGRGQRKRVPLKSAVKNLVLTEKGDLDEDKYSPQVKTSDLLDKDSNEL